MTNWNTIRASARKLLAQEGLSVTISWGEASIVGVRTTLKRADVNTDDGLISGHYSFSVLVSLDDLPAMPTRRDKVSIDGTLYRVLSTETDAVGATVRLDLGDILQ